MQKVRKQIEKKEFYITKISILLYFNTCNKIRMFFMSANLTFLQIYLAFPKCCYFLSATNCLHFNAENRMNFVKSLTLMGVYLSMYKMSVEMQILKESYEKHLVISE